MGVASALDAILDCSVIGGYGRPGYAARRRLSTWPADPVRRDGAVVAVTGATAGIGLAAAIGFARLGARVHLVGRDEGRTEAAAESVRAAVEGADVVADLCDVSSLASLRAFTDRWTGSLDVLVNNAGILSQERRVTEDGVEVTFATNVLGPFVLIERLADRMPAGGRIITVSSGGMYGQRLDADLQSAQDYKPVAAYARSKRAEVVLTEQWAARLPALAVHAMHPGWADTPGIQGSLSSFAKVAAPILRTPDQGADTVVWLGGTAEDLPTGRFWHDRRPRPTHLLGLNRETEADRTRLWEVCADLSARIA